MDNKFTYNQNKGIIPSGLCIQISFGEFAKISLPSGETIEIHLVAIGGHKAKIKFNTKKENIIIREEYKKNNLAN